MWTRFSMDSANTAASNQPRPPPVTAERIADAFESYARKLAEAGVPLDRIAEGLSMAAVRAEVAHREDLMHKLRDTVAGNAASGPRPMRTVAGPTSEADRRQAQARRIWPTTLRPAERLFMAASQLAPQSTVQAARLLLDRLKALALEPSIEGQDVHSTLLAVPEDKRDLVLAVLGELVGRTSDRGFEDLAQGARLVLDAARELWREQGKLAEDTAPAEAGPSAGSGERP